MKRDVYIIFILAFQYLIPAGHHLVPVLVSTSFLPALIMTAEEAHLILESDEKKSEADMEMSTSPSISPSLPSTLDCCAVQSNVTPGTQRMPTLPWFGTHEAVVGASGMVGDPVSTAYMMFGYMPLDAHCAERYSATHSSNTKGEIIRLQHAVLYPPNPGAPLPVVRERPPGCRTVFIGGLPEKCTEETIHELMAHCGEIQSVRMSKKNFAHVRFVSYESVDRAISFSGYRIKMDDRSEKEYAGRLHVDYAHARDDMHEWESERARSNSASPSTSSHFSENEATALLEKLKDVETFTDASSLLAAWLDKGECCKKTSTVFYGMIAAVNAHVRRLLHDRRQYEEELCEFRDKQNQRMQELMTQFRQIEKIFRLARKQKNWDHFSRAQRKNVDTWLKHAEITRKASEEAMLRDRHEEEMETSDDEEDGSQQNEKLAIDNCVQSPNKKRKIGTTDDDSQRQLQELRDENTRLKATLEALRSGSCNPFIDGVQDIPNSAKEWSIATTQTVDSTITDNRSSELESRYIALLSCFLNVHPFGATLDYMLAYLQQIVENVRIGDIENTLERHPQLFRLETSGVGATYERKWTFIGFEK